MRYKSILLVALLAFGVTLAVIVGQRLSAEAMAVIIGVVAGVAASIPTSLIVVWIATRERPVRVPEPASPPDESGAPRIVVVHAPPQTAPQMTAPAYPYANTYANPYPQPQSHAFAPSYPPLSAPRTFTVIGGETLEDYEAE